MSRKFSLLLGSFSIISVAGKYLVVPKAKGRKYDDHGGFDVSFILDRRMGRCWNILDFPITFLSCCLYVCKHIMCFMYPIITFRGTKAPFLHILVRIKAHNSMEVKWEIYAKWTFIQAQGRQTWRNVHSIGSRSNNTSCRTPPHVIERHISPSHPVRSLLPIAQLIM